MHFDSPTHFAVVISVIDQLATWLATIGGGGGRWHANPAHCHLHVWSQLSNNRVQPPKLLNSYCYMTTSLCSPFSTWFAWCTCISAPDTRTTIVIPLLVDHGEQVCKIFVVFYCLILGWLHCHCKYRKRWFTMQQWDRDKKFSTQESQDRARLEK